MAGLPPLTSLAFPLAFSPIVPVFHKCLLELDLLKCSQGKIVMIVRLMSRVYVNLKDHAGGCLNNSAEDGHIFQLTLDIEMLSSCFCVMSFCILLYPSGALNVTRKKDFTFLSQRSKKTV